MPPETCYTPARRLEAEEGWGIEAKGFYIGYLDLKCDCESQLFVEGDETMFARAVNVQFQSGKVDEASHIVQDSIVPVLKEQKGFKGQLLLTQRDTGKAISLNLWQTEGDLTAFEASPLYRQLMGKLAGVMAGPPAGERYEVSVQA